MISARRLRKSSFNQEYNLNLDFLDFSNDKIKEINKKNKLKNENTIKIDNKFKLNLIICSFLLFLVTITKIFFWEDLENNSKILRVYNHYKFDFSKELVLNNFENFLKSKEYIIDNIIPIKIKENCIIKYNNIFKPYLIKFSFLNLLNNNNDIDIYKYKNIDIYDKINNNEIRTFNLLDKKLELEKENLINEEKFINPTVGIVTSRFGNRPVIFKGVNPYHTGIDIANKEGTDIVSVSNGKVIATIFNNRYYGNYVIIKSGKYKFKYAHLNEILVKNNEFVEKGKLIGKMGNTGLSTGPHLHFEVMINDNLINPEERFNFNEI